MAIPDFQSLMLPLLGDLASDTERGNQDTLDALATSANLSDDERTQPTGNKIEAGSDINNSRSDVQNHGLKARVWPAVIERIEQKQLC